jgi:2-(3-amino-3-carboxypropyl)histidine synthase
VAFDTAHLIATVRANFPRSARLALLGTIQFAPALYELKTALDAEAAAGGGEAASATAAAAAAGGGAVLVPQARPLSPGEVLGCTSPRLGAELRLDAFVFVADGRFHLESVMIHNPDLPAFRYDPYARTMTRERYDTPAMLAARRAAVARAASATSFGLILGTLGRQGSTALLERLEAKLEAAGKRHFTLLLSEISPAKLERFGGAVEAWVQVACPRLSIDWGGGFGGVPLLTPYECEVALGTTAWREVYPMDYYARGSGSWTNYFK